MINGEDILETCKLFGINASTLAVVSLSDLELILKCVLLIATIVWTALKVAALWKQLKETEKEK